MKRLCVLPSLLLIVSLTLVSTSQAQDEDDQVTLTISATCTANAAIQDRDMSLKDQMTASLSERATYRIVSSEGGLLHLELVSHKNSITVTGGGTFKDKNFSSSWTYRPDNPTTSNVQSGVMIDTTFGEGSVNLLNFIREGGVKADKEGGWPLAEQVADGALTHATSTIVMPLGTVESNEQFMKDLSFSFDPNSKQISSGGQAKYQFTFHGDKGPVGTGTLTVSYRVQSGSPGELEAVLIPRGDYKKWLPKAAGKGASLPGNYITFDVELRNPRGEEVNEKTAQFEIELLETSRHPGSCMNSPWTGSDPDLKILKIDNPNLAKVAADGQKARTAKGLTSASITISSFDGAALGRLAVLAHIDGEDTILAAHFEGEPDLLEVSIPYDSDGNNIADIWEIEHDVWGKPVEVDEDADPPGDRHNGDGITAWEEYRGFLEDGKHIRTDPRKKDLFICDTYGGRSKRGIDRFVALTKLAVHDKLTLEELSPSRIVNRNRSEDAPHVVDQHGLLLDGFNYSGQYFAGKVTTPQGYDDDPGPPKTAERIIISRNLPDTVTRVQSDGTRKSYEYFSRIVAHELLHCCSVWHHGESDTKVFWQAETVAGKTRFFEYDDIADTGHPERGRVVSVWNEDGGEYLPDRPFWRTPKLIYLGEDHGQHSGDEDCVMRYSVSDAYKINAVGRFLLLWKPQESVPQGLCVNAVGTGVNKAGRVPKSRYGDADAGRGSCAHKICVNDLYH